MLAPFTALASLAAMPPTAALALFLLLRASLSGCWLGRRRPLLHAGLLLLLGTALQSVFAPRTALVARTALRLLAAAGLLLALLLPARLRLRPLVTRRPFATPTILAVAALRASLASLL